MISVQQSSLSHTQHTHINSNKKAVEINMMQLGQPSHNKTDSCLWLSPT